MLLNPFPQPHSSRMVFGVSTTDPFTYALVTGMRCWRSTGRPAAVDPMTSLRVD